MSSYIIFKFLTNFTSNWRNSSNTDPFIKYYENRFVACIRMDKDEINQIVFMVMMLIMMLTSVTFYPTPYAHGEYRAQYLYLSI